MRMTVMTVTTMTTMTSKNSKDIPKALDRQCAARARLMHEDNERGLITVIEGKIDDIEQKMVQEHLEGDLKDLIESLIEEYDPQKQYVLVVVKNGELDYIGRRDL
jgi:hypothetical protein